MIFTFSFLTNISPHSTQTAQKREKSSAWRRLCSAQRCLCSDLPLSAGRIFSWGLTLGLQLHLACMRMSMSPHSCQQSKGYVTTGPNNYPLHQSIIEGSAKIKTGYGTTSPSFSPRKGKINTWSHSSLLREASLSPPVFYTELDKLFYKKPDSKYFRFESHTKPQLHVVFLLLFTIFKNVNPFLADGPCKNKAQIRVRLWALVW